MLCKTHIVTPAVRERIVTIFPCVASEGLYDGNLVVTTDDEPKHPEFTVWRVDRYGEVEPLVTGHKIGTVFTSLPKAIRFARQQNGWG